MTDFAPQTINNKGESCSRCKARRVKCWAEERGGPCRACLRSAKFKGHNLGEVYCAYPYNPTGPSRCSEESGDPPQRTRTRRRRKARQHFTPDSTTEESDADDQEDVATPPPPPPKRRRPNPVPEVAAAATAEPTVPSAIPDEPRAVGHSEVVQLAQETSVEPPTSAPEIGTEGVPAPTSSFAAHRPSLAQMHLDLSPLTMSPAPLTAEATSSTSVARVGAEWSSSFAAYPFSSGEASPAFPSSSHSVSSRSSTASPYLMDLPFDFGGGLGLGAVDDYFFGGGGHSGPLIAGEDPMIGGGGGAEAGVSTPYWYGYSAGGAGWPVGKEGKGAAVADMSDGMDGVLSG